MKRTTLVLVGFFLLLAGGMHLDIAARNATAQDQEKPAGRASEARAKAAQALLEAARKASEITTKEYDEGTVTLTDVYVWSRRLLDAQRAVAKSQDEDLEALEDHRKRMQRLQRITQALYEKRARGGEEQKVRALAYYVAEVDLWVIDAGGEPPRDAR